MTPLESMATPLRLPVATVFSTPLYWARGMLAWARGQAGTKTNAARASVSAATRNLREERIAKGERMAGEPSSAASFIGGDSRDGRDRMTGEMNLALRR